jgi:hypothetical protein
MKLAPTRVSSTIGLGNPLAHLAVSAFLTAAAITSASAEGVGPLVIAKQGHFFIGGKANMSIPRTAR